MGPAAVLSIMVRAQGVQATSTQLGALDKNARRAGTGLSTTEKHAKRSGAAFASLGKAAGLAGVAVGAAGLAAGVKLAVGEFREAQKVGAQTNAVLKSTGSAAKVTKKHIEDLAGAISRKSGIDDEAIQTGENLLLTFKGIRNETGKGNKIFDQATQVITDMSVSLKQGLKPSAIQVGKALNDPIKGLSALGRVGVTFTEDQKKQVAALVKSGDTLGAQKIILRELKSEFQGSAAAQATAGDKLKVAWGNLAEAAGGILVPALDKVATFFTKVINQFVQGEGIAKFIIPVFTGIRDAVVSIATNQSVIKFFTDFKDAMVILFNTVAPFVQDTAPKLVGFFKSLPGPVQAALAAFAGFAALFLVSGPLMVGIAAFAVAAVLIKRNWSTIAPIIQQVGDAVMHLRDSISAWVTKNQADIAVVIKTFKDVGEVAKAVFQVAFPVVLAVAKRQFEALKTVVSGQLELVKGVINVFLGLLHGDWSRVWGGLKDIAAGGLKAAWGAVKAQTAAFREIGTRLVGAVVDGLSLLGHEILNRFKDAANFVIRNVGDLFKGVGGAIGKGVGKINPFGDGVGKLPSGGGGSSALMGASSSLAPFASAGARFGLHVSSGRRPGAITSSGNVSYHSTGEAIDEADGVNGPSPAKLAFFKFMRSTFGSRLAELIYTPGGVGIKNGQPYRYTGQVAADHYNHVHVALDTGNPGPGDGHGKISGARKALTGDGIGVAVDAARKAGFSGTDLVNMVAIAGRESGYNPRVHNLNARTHDDSWGLWQINVLPEANPQYKNWKLTDPYVNAKAARQLFTAGGLRPWHGLVGVTASMLSRARAAVTGSRGGKKLTAAQKKAATKAPRVNPKQAQKAIAHGSAIHPQSEAAFNALNDQRLAQATYDAGRGGADTQLAQNQIDAAANMPTLSDFGDAQLALARLTDTTSDDVAALQNLEGIYSGKLAEAQAGGDPREIVDAAGNLKGVRDELKSLTAAVDNVAEKLTLQTQIAQDALKKYNVSQSDYGTLAKAIASVASGEIGGRIGLGFMTPGFSGGGSRY